MRTFVWGLGRAVDLDIEITQVVLVGDGTDTGDAVDESRSEVVTRAKMKGTK
jgi:hypothetical protein